MSYLSIRCGAGNSWCSMHMGGACTNSGNLRLMIAGNNEAIMEQKYGDMGNSIRDKHKKEKGDFVMFADDDNWYFQQPPPVSCCTVIITRNSDAP